MMVLATDHPAQAAKVALDLVGAAFQRGIGFTVIDAANLPAVMQSVPMGGFIGMHGGHSAYVLHGQLNTF